jgi:peroxiredoxin
MEENSGRADSNFLEPGEVAPPFELQSAPDKTIKLGDLRGKPVIIAFYPADFSPVCGDQIALYNEILPEFRRYGAEILGISVDSVWCHAAFAKQKNIRFPLLADFEPKGEVARTYGAYRTQDGTAERALFVIDRDGIIHWSYCSPVSVNPGADGILRALDSLAERDRGATMTSSPARARNASEAEARP